MATDKIRAKRTPFFMATTGNSARPGAAKSNSQADWYYVPVKQYWNPGKSRDKMKHKGAS